jgi:hypothetical protein
MLLHEGAVVKNSGGHPVGLSVREKACLHRLTPESSLYDMPTVSIMASFLFVSKQEVVRAGLSPSDRQTAPYPSLTVRAHNVRVADDTLSTN